MIITGHRIISVFHRYHIVSPGDLQAVAIRLQTDTILRHNGWNEGWNLPIL